MEDRAVSLAEIAARRFSRRGVLGSAGALSLLSLTGCATPERRATGFASVPASIADTITVPDGYRVHTLIAWGDPLFETAAAPFDPDTITRAEQEQRFGLNNDMLALYPLPWRFPAPHAGERALLCVNHEHFTTAMTFPSVARADGFTQAQMQATFAALGVSVVEIAQERDGWRVRRDAAPGDGLNRRITPFTPVRFEGPAANHPWIRAAGEVMRRHEGGGADVIPCGTMVNCAGGATPWGTYLTAEEALGLFFSCSDENAPALQAARTSPAYVADARTYVYPFPAARRLPLTPPQFDLANNPTGPSLYGWIVEIDPYDPDWAPRKRTALGRRWNECATTALTRDGRVAVYSGDDFPNQFVYKFVSAGRFDPTNRTANRDLLNDGVLYAARFEEDGSGAWLPLTFEAVSAAAAGYEPRGFCGRDHAHARGGAPAGRRTPMDRPEDIEPVVDDNWVGEGAVLINCTGSAIRRATAPANPRRDDPEGEREQPNLTGHIVRIDEDGADVGARTFRWNMFALCGDPANAGRVQTPAGRTAFVSTAFNGAPTISGDRFANPDNLCIDRARNVWMTTDGLADVWGDCNDAVFVTPLSAEGPRPVKRFLVGPVGGEICGPVLSFDERAFFVSVQHPGVENAAGENYATLRWEQGRARPLSSWPLGGEAWPRPAVVFVTKEDGGVIGT